MTWKSIEAEVASKAIQRKIKRKKRRITPDKQRHGQGASKLATTREGPVGVPRPGVDAPSTSGQPAAAPRVKGSWKPSKQQPLESTATDAEPMKTVGSCEQPIVTDTFALDDSQTYRRHKPSSKPDDKPRAAMQSVADRFKSRNSALTQEIKKVEPSQRGGIKKSRHSSCGQDVGASRLDSLNEGGGPSRIRHASSPLSVGQSKKCLATPTSTSGVPHDVIDQLPMYAQSVYKTKTAIPANPDVTAAEKSLPNIPGAAEPSQSDARLTNPELVEPVSITSQQQKDPPQPSPPDESSSPAIAKQPFQFFTSDPQTKCTAATLSSNAVSGISKNQATSQALHQTQNSTCEKVVTDNQAPTSRQPYQQNESHHGERVAGRPLPLQAIDVNAKQRNDDLQHPNTSQQRKLDKGGRSSIATTAAVGQSPPRQATKVSAQPGLVLQGREAVRLPKTSGLTEEDFFSWVIGWNSQWLDIFRPEAGNELHRCKYGFIAFMYYKIG